MTKFGAAENEMERLMAKFAQRTPTEHSQIFENVFCYFQGVSSPILILWGTTPTKTKVLLTMEATPKR